MTTHGQAGSTAAAPAALEWIAPGQPPMPLFVLLHGVGGQARDMEPVAAALRRQYPSCAVVALQGFDPFDGTSPGTDAADGRRQWFSVRGIDDTSRPARVALALPALAVCIQALQQRLQVSTEATAIIGFSQGAIMGLELSALHDGLVGRVVAVAGRYATLPRSAPLQTTLHLLHGSADTVMPPSLAQQAFAHLGALDGDVTLDMATGVGHEFHPALLDQMLVRLQTCVPLRLWRQVVE